jgi:hypothetical protein
LVKGKENVVADMLSRIQGKPTTDSNNSRDGEEVEDAIDTLLYYAVASGF